MNKLKTYEAPSTRVAKVELRTNLLAASIMQDKPQSVKTEGHEVGGDYTFLITSDEDFNQTITGGSVTWE